MTTNCQGPILSEPIKFLGASVLSFNTSLGIGSASESTLSVELVEDCEDGDLFEPSNNLKEVGEPVFFTAENFSFGGVLTSWNKNEGSSGRTFSVTVTDPRQLLQNAGVVVDSYIGPPSYGINYFNVYAHYERDVLSGDCDKFGDSFSNERGMPYKMVIQALQEMQPVIYSPTGYPYTVDWDSFPTGLPEYYRVTGPQTVLQLLQDVCDVLGFSFYVNLTIDSIITVGTINLKSPPGSFETIINAFSGLATDLSFGEELRNEVTKAIIFGEQQHYLSYVDQFEFYFGEDLYGTEYVPVTPTKFDPGNNTFWISKKVDKLNATLLNPFDGNGPYQISELDIRAAMSSYELWSMRVFDPGIEGSFNAEVRKLYPEITDAFGQRAENMDNRGLGDGAMNPRAARVLKTAEDRSNELQKIHAFIQDLGTTYYGKQFIVPLNETICAYQGENFQEKIFSSVPTNAGGWIEGDVAILGISDPELGLFRSDDNRVTSFGVFTISGDSEDGGGDPEDPGNPYNTSPPPDSYSQGDHTPD
jgi:hypothetical protein